MEHCIHKISSSEWSDYFPLFSPVVVILLFGLERVLSYKTKKKEIERTWYYKVLIDPALSKVTEFFNTIQVLYADSCAKLSSSQDLRHDEYISLKSSEIGKFQKIKRVFDIDIITPINHKYPIVGEKLQNKLMDLEDCFTYGLDNELFSENDIDHFSTKVSKIRAVWLNVLYEPIE